MEQSTDKEREEYQQQESQRYSSPHLPYQWQQHGYTATVGPVRGGGAGGGKPKNHR